MSVSPQTVWYEEVLGKDMGWNIWLISFKIKFKVYMKLYEAQGIRNFGKTLAQGTILVIN